MEEIKLLKGKWFSDIIPSFEDETIYDKTTTGCGGTTTAINEGYCVVISPNVSGITSKELYPNVVAVYSGVLVKNIADQIHVIEKQELKPTIISTPDSFSKVLTAIGEEIFTKYKCVVDEIHCFQEDSTFRDVLAQFIEEDFVKFKRKCVITATYTKLSHPMFRG